MCGIYYIFKFISSKSILNASNFKINIESLNKNNISRGPDLTFKIDVNCNYGSILMSGSVLHFQGKNIQQQPICENNKTIPSCMLWNGEIFSGNITSDYKSSDTKIVFEKIFCIENKFFHNDYNKFQKDEACKKFINEIRDMLESIGGPFSIIYYSSRFDVTIFSRDPMGRRSLMFHISSINESKLNYYDNELIISSVSSEYYNNNSSQLSWIEIPVNGIFCVYNSNNISSIDDIKCIAEWKYRHVDHPLIKPHPDLFLQKNIITGSTFLDLLYNSTLNFLNKSWNLNQTNFYVIAQSITRVVQFFDYKLDKNCDTSNNILIACYLSSLVTSVYRRVSLSLRCGDNKNQPIMILFSGGIDSTMLAALTHIVLSGTEEELNIPIELINVASGQTPFSAPDRLASVKAIQELQKLPKSEKRDWRLIFVDISKEELEKSEKHIKQLIHPRNTIMDINIGSALWFGSRGIGKRIDLSNFIQNQPIFDDILSRTQLRFGNALEKKSNIKKFNIQYTEYEQLVNYVINELITQESNSDFVFLGKLRSDNLQIDMEKHCCKSILDLAHKAKKDKIIQIYKPDKINYSLKLVRESDVDIVKQEKQKYDRIFSELTGEYNQISKYISQSRVVLLGMGADESLGGYSRCRTKKSLQEELQIDFKRLWERNLGRDDRLVCDHGREGRFPFLDEDVLSVLSGNYCSIKIDDVCDIKKDNGIGEKILLRTCARMIGLSDISLLVKRAIQFGTRIADRRINGATLLN